MKTPACIVAFAACLVAAAPAAAQDMERVRALYVAAAYEEALAAMPAEPSAAPAAELEQYRALCLLALGREDEARAAVERLVKAQPSFVPPAGEVSPRMLTLFSSVRAALLPDIAKEAYVEAKAAYEKKDHDAARAGFERTLALIDSMPEEGREAVADMRLLAADFRDLIAARPAKPAEASASAPPASVTPPENAAPSGVFVPAVAIRQELPPWTPLDAAARRNEYVGLLQVHIAPDGRVTLARMLKPSHPSYDVAVLREARRWVYKPATRGGQPVASEREIEIRLRPDAR